MLKFLEITNIHERICRRLGMPVYIYIYISVIRGFLTVY